MSRRASRRSLRASGLRFALSASITAALLMSVIALEAQRRGANNAASGVPIGTASLLAHPEKYYGRVVTMSAGIEQVLSKTAFVIDQRKMVTPTEVRAAGAPVLIIAPELTDEPDPKHYVMVKGQVVRFTAAEIEKAVPGYRLDLPQEASDRFAGQPVLIASSVLNSVYQEIGRRPPRPEELELSKAMKVISPALAGLRTAAQQSTTDAIASN